MTLLLHVAVLMCESPHDRTSVSLSTHQTKLKMKKALSHLVLVMLATAALVPRTQAGGITNNFNTGADFVAAGVIGTVWDGVYLKGGDVTGSSGGGDTLQANETTFPGFLTVQSTLGGWAGAQNDGFFLYKLVSGDFDVSVQNVPPYASDNFTFGGLLVRAGNFQNGASLAGGENWLGLARFQEFGLGDGVRFATNGADSEFLYTGGDNSDTNSSRFYRITRAGDVFSFYNKTNAGDAWTLQTTLTRGDLSGLPMQVGIQQAVYTPNTPVNYFTGFELTGPSVATGTPPADASGIAVSVVNSNSVNISWTPGLGSAGSVVLIRANAALAHKPADGFVYTGNTNFADAAGILGGSGVHAVYVGTGSSVVVSGLGGSNNVYTVAVVSYQGAGAATVYGANPVTNAFAGPGTLQSVSFTVSPSVIPVGGVSGATLTATYSSGESYDVSAAPGTVWSSGNTAAISVNNGTLSGLAVGTSEIIATYAGISGTNTVSVVTPAFTDDFSVTHSFVTNGVAGSKWDGVYLKFGDIPGGTDDGGPGAATVATANGVTNNALVVTANNTQWAGAQDDGFLLFKKVSGDFQASVHVQFLQRIAFQFAGLMARASETNGGPLGGSEDWVNIGGFGQFGVSTDVRNVVNGADSETTIVDGDNVNNFWFLMRRSGDTFSFFRKVNAGDEWTPLPTLTQTRPDLAGLPVQVGLFEAMFTANSGTVVFDSFMLDAAGLSAGTPPNPPAGLNFTSVGATSMTINWTPGAGSTGSVVVVRAANPVNANPINGVTYNGSATFGAGSHLGSGNYVVYVGTGSSVTVTGLTPGTKYFVAVYSYGGPVGARVYNTTVNGGVNSVTVGTPQSLTVTVPGKLPRGGVARAVAVVNYSGGFSTAVNSGLVVTSSDTNIVSSYQATSLLSGMSNGTATITVVYTEGATSLTNTVAVTVNAPTYMDNFNASHDYKTSGVTGTIWDGVYATPGSIPGTTYTSDPSASISVVDANTTSNNVLTVTYLNVGWEGAQNDGFFLYKNIPGDFQVAVHLNAPLLAVTETETNVVAIYNTPGLLARPYTGNGAPFVGGTNESWISWTRFDEFGIGTYARRTLNNGTQQNTQPGFNDGEFWLLMTRQNGTNFSFYQRKEVTDPWRPAPTGITYPVAAFAGQPMQVGIQACAFNSGVTATAQFDSFMLDTGLPKLEVVKSGGNVVVSWPVAPATLQSTVGLVPANWQNVTAPLATNSGVVSVTLPATNSTLFFRLAQ